MRAVLLLCVAASFLTPATAQPRVGLDAGLAVPTGALGQYRSAGATATVSVGLQRAGWSPRAEIAIVRLFEGQSPDEGGRNSGRGEYTSFGARGSMMYRSPSTTVAPYALAGLGVYGIAIAQDENPYGSAFAGLHVGLGIEVPVRQTTLAVEAGAVVLATDYGAGAFNFPTLHVPITVGVRF